MLYVYYVNEDYETLEQALRYNTVANNKDLKQWDENHYIGKTKYFSISNGRKFVANNTMGNFVNYYYRDYVCIYSRKESADIDFNYINVKYSREDALEHLRKDLDNEYSKYADRIFNSKDMFIETQIILDEIMIDYLNSITEKLQQRIKELKEEQCNL